MDVTELGKIMTKLGKKYKNEKILYETLIQIWKNLENEEFLDEISKKLDQLQEISNKYYSKYGVSEEILDLQVWINQTRNKYNIPDPAELMSNGFAQ